MYGLLLALLVLDGILLIVAVLLQAGKGGGLAGMGGGVTATEGVLGGRQAATFLTRATWTTGAIFMVLSLVLAIRSSLQQQPGSILQEAIQAPAPTPVVPEAQPSTGTPAVQGGGAVTPPPAQP